MQTKVKCPKIDEAKIIAELEALPDKANFTLFEDEMIFKYYPIKGSRGLSVVLKKSQNKIAARFHTIKGRFKSE